MTRIAVASLLALLLAGVRASQSRQTVDKATVDLWMTELSNWGRWGKEDSAERNMPIHQLTLVAMGMPLFDNLDLEAVAAEAAKRGRWEFLLTAAPLTVSNATGSPLNPLAIF